MMLRMRKEMSENDLNRANSVNANGNEIDQIIIIDREVDMISPLCTQVTYEGFLSSDEPSKYIEEAIDRQESLLTVLRLFCLQSLTLGIKASRFEQLKREILQVIKETPFFRKKENAQTCLFFKKKK